MSEFYYFGDIDTCFEESDLLIISIDQDGNLFNRYLFDGRLTDEDSSYLRSYLQYHARKTLTPFNIVCNYITFNSGLRRIVGFMKLYQPNHYTYTHFDTLHRFLTADRNYFYNRYFSSPYYFYPDYPSVYGGSTFLDINTYVDSANYLLEYLEGKFDDYDGRFIFCHD